MQRTRFRDDELSSSEEKDEESLNDVGSGGNSGLEPTDAEEATAPTNRSNIAEFDININHHSTSTSSTA